MNNKFLAGAGFLLLIGLGSYVGSANFRGFTRTKVLHKEVTLDHVSATLENALPVGTPWVAVDEYLMNNNIEHSQLVAAPPAESKGGRDIASVKPKAAVIPKKSAITTVASNADGSIVYALIKSTGWAESKNVNVAIEFTFDQYKNLRHYKVKNTFSSF